MHLTIFGNTDAAAFAPRWTDESVTVVFGSAWLDLTARPPADDATLSVRAVFGSARIIVPAGSRLEVTGVSVFGGRSVDVRPGDGPILHLRAGALFGSIEVIESPPDAQPQSKCDERVFRPETAVTRVDVGVQPG